MWNVDFGNAKSRHESTHRKKHQRHQRYTGNGENWAVVLFQKRFTGTLTQSALQQQRQRVRYTSSTSGVTIVRWRFSVIGFYGWDSNLYSNIATSWNVLAVYVRKS